MIKLIDKPLTSTTLHRVREGETMQSICTKYNTTKHQIMKDNPYNIEIYPGSMILISNCNKQIYIVNPLDNISKIAKKLNKTESEIREIVGGSVVFIGQILEFD